MAQNPVPLTLVAANAHDLELTPLPDGGWEIRTTGGDPYVFTAPLTAPVDPRATFMLAFDFFSATGTDAFQVFCQPPLSEANSVKGPGLSRSEGWSRHALDLSPVLTKLGGQVGSLRLDFGNQPGRTLQLRSPRLRPPTDREQELAAQRQARLDLLARNDAWLRDYLRHEYPARVTSVRADANAILVVGELAGAQGASLVEVPMWVDTDQPAAFLGPHPIVADAAGRFVVRVPRLDGARDRLLSRWAVARQGDAAPWQLLSSAHYADQVQARWDLPVPKASGRKGLGGFGLERPRSDLVDLGISYATVNLVLNSLFSTTPAAGWSPFEYAGRTWYAHDSQIASFDRTFRALAEHGVITSVIVLIGQPGASPAGSYSRLLTHPDADPAGIFVMPDVTSQAGVEAYCAGLDYLARRYSDPAGGHGRVHHWILHNEVNAGWIWTNAGEKTDVQYMDLYQRSLRCAWLVARQYDAGAKVFVSLEHHWTMKQDPRCHPGRDLLDCLLTQCAVEGDFEWALAHHPYPQNLFEPRVWADTQVRSDFDTPKITFKNMDVLDAWMRQPRALYHGRPRTVHLTEQGLNSRDYSEKELAAQAAGMAYTWAKLRRLPSIEAFDYHNWVDNRGEGGLRIGLRKFPDEPGDPSGRKPIWYVYQALDTPQEAEATAFALPIIGIKGWDEVK
ncbi:MAG: hypothetical protein HZB16_11610 [Armatimonadetes bacterium]|nr:hypothetical protein [Armatimonadota bacterium]